MWCKQSIAKQVTLIFIGLLAISNCNSQTPTYTIDPNFNTGELFRDGSPVLIY